jgi:uncharacterized protein YdeI (YjbR/CyaY-like superfamily)
MDAVKRLYVKNREEWRYWLGKHHASENEIWLVYYKKHTGKPSIPYGDAVEESLCFGWIDSTIKRIDEERYLQKFSPRNIKSNWSELNIQRAEKMIKAGLMTEAGLKKFKNAYEKNPTHTPKKILEIPEFLLKKIKSHSDAYEYFKSLAPCHQRNYIAWITHAKKQETIEKRMQEAITLLQQKQKLGMK